jgi:hypothetical protein
VVGFRQANAVNNDGPAIVALSNEPGVRASLLVQARAGPSVTMQSRKSVFENVDSGEPPAVDDVGTALGFEESEAQKKDDDRDKRKPMPHGRRRM